jgi:hypothetical protein
MRRNATRRNATWRNTWAQFGIGAGALLLPPLVLGAAFYSMLAAPEEEATRPHAVRAAPTAPPIAPPAAAAPAATVPRPARNSTEEVAQTTEQVPVQVSPVQVAATPAAAAVNLPAYAEGGATSPAAESPPAPTAAKRVVHRHRQPQQEPFPLKNWLQQIGILPRNGKSARDTRG